MPKPRIALVLEATAGGTRKHVRELALGLDSRRFDVDLVLSFERCSEMLADLPELIARGARVHAVPMVRQISPILDALALGRLVRLFRRERFDLVHTHCAKAGFLGRLAARMAGRARVVHTPHVWPFDWAVGPVRGLYLGLERLAAGRTDAFVCLGPHQRDGAIVEGLLPADGAHSRLRVIANGVNARRFEAGAERRGRARAELGLAPDLLAVGMVGRLVRQKGVGCFVEAAAKVARTRADARFFIIGDGPGRRRAVRHARSVGLGEGRLAFLGQRDDVDRLYAGLDAFVLSSVYEGLPYVLLEAAAAGLPIVATRVAGVDNVIVDGESGLLVPPEDPGSLAQAIVSVLSDAVRRRHLGRTAKKEVETRFRLDRFLREHERLYLDLLNQ